MRRWLVFLLCMLIVAACGPTTSPEAPEAEPVVVTEEPPDLSHVDPKTLAGELTPVASLGDAAGEMASALGVDEALVRVRVQARGCTVCAAEDNRTGASVAGLAVAEAAEQLQTGDTFWLVVSRIICTYQFDGSLYTPQSCQEAPL